MWNKYVKLFQVYLFDEAMEFHVKDASSCPLPLTLSIHNIQKGDNATFLHTCN